MATPHPPARLTAEEIETLAAKPSLFTLGALVITDGAFDLCTSAAADPVEYILRHVKGDFGTLDPHDQAENAYGIRHHTRVMSEYRLPITNAKLWVITDAGHA